MRTAGNDSDFGMGFEEILIVKASIPDNAEPVCNHAEFIGITGLHRKQQPQTQRQKKSKRHEHEQER